MSNDIVGISKKLLIIRKLLIFKFYRKFSYNLISPPEGRPEILPFTGSELGSKIFDWARSSDS